MKGIHLEMHYPQQGVGLTLSTVYNSLSCILLLISNHPVSIGCERCQKNKIKGNDKTISTEICSQKLDIGYVLLRIK